MSIQEEVKKAAERLEWQNLPERVERMVDNCSAPTWAVKRALWQPTTVPTSFFYLSESPTLMISAPSAVPEELLHQKQACSQIFGKDNVQIQIGDPGNLLDDGWVKLAETNPIRRIGEYLNFFPGKYPGGVTNHPSPLASMLTSGLVGAGLGYGAGYLGEKILPETWKRKKLRRLLALLGAGIGAAPGALWAYTNVKRNKPWNDASLTSDKGRLMAGPQHMSPFPERPHPWDIDPRPNKQEDVNKFLDYNFPTYDFDTGVLSDPYKEASDSIGYDEYLHPDFVGFLKKARSYSDDPSPTMGIVPPVQKDYLGRVTWGDNLIGNALNARQKSQINTVVDAASRMPGSPGPNLVSPAQFGNLAMNMGKGYLVGAMVGAGLGLIGAPTETQKTLARTGMWAGVANTLINSLF